MHYMVKLSSFSTFLSGFEFLIILKWGLEREGGGGGWVQSNRCPGLVNLKGGKNLPNFSHRAKILSQHFPLGLVRLYTYIQNKLKGTV